MFQATHTPLPTAFSERGKNKEENETKNRKHLLWMLAYSILYLTHTISGQGTSHEHTKRLFIAFKGTLLSQSMESCLPGCVTGDQRLAFTLCGLIRLWLNNRQSAAGLSLKLHSFITYQIPLCRVFQFETNLTPKWYYKPDTVKRHGSGKHFRRWEIFNESLKQNKHRKIQSGT